MEQRLGTLGHWRGGAQRHTSRRWARNAVVGVVCGAAAAGSLVVQATTAGAIVPGPNGQIAFESNRSGDTDIYVMGPDGTTEINLTADYPGIDVFPAWSPDGSKITFSSDRHNPPGLEFPDLDVFVMNADGSGVTQLTNSPGEDRGTSWTSDGQTIVFHSARDRDATHTFDIFKMNADGSNETKIFTNGSAAYVCGDSTNGIIVFNSSGDPLGTNPPIGTNPITGAPIRDFEIFTMNMNGGDVFQVTSNTVLDSGPKWSPDCTQIVYNSLETNVPAGVTPSLDIHRINADGTNDVNLTNAPGVFDAFGAWSPNGNRIVFSTNRDVNFEIYSMRASDGGGLRRLTNTGLGQADLRSDWGTNTSTPSRTALTCAPGTSNAGNPIFICNVSDTDGLRIVQVRVAATGEQQVGLVFPCDSNAPKSAEVRIPANTRYKVTIQDCANPRNTTRFVILPGGFVRES